MLKTEKQKVSVIGAGMAGVETAMMLARHGVAADLYEMRPRQKTPAHQSGDFAELVCSNSFGSMAEFSAPGLLKEEMRALGSTILEGAQINQVPAGNALGVDREAFAQWVTTKVKEHPLIDIIDQECKEIPKEGFVVVATGPLTSDNLTQSLADLLDTSSLYFYDSISPIVEASSVDLEKTFFASRYQEDQDDYLNCPMTQEQYMSFVEAIAKAEKVPVRDFEELKCFEGCQPIENLVDRGVKTLAFGPMKPVGLRDPKTQNRPYAVVQLRRENMPTTMYNLVGFQSRMKWGEQKRIFRMIPGLENATFVRMGSMHRNTYIESPKLLASDLSLKTDSRIFFAGQLTGVEGYVESAAMGQMVALALLGRIHYQAWHRPPPETALGALLRVITTDPLRSEFSPMNINFGLLPPLQDTARMKKKVRREKQCMRARQSFQAWFHEQAYQ